MAELNFPGTIRSGAKENGVLVPIVYAEEAFDKLLNKFQSAINSEFQTAIANLQNRKIVKVETSLPPNVTDEYKNVVILVPQSGGVSGDYFTEYIWNDTRNEFEQIGSLQTSVDLSEYYDKNEVDQKISEIKETVGGASVSYDEENETIIVENSGSGSTNPNPLRPLFLAEGAVYNDTGADIVDAYDAPWGTVNGILEKITHKAGCYYFNGLGDITEEEMLNIYRYGRLASNGQYSRADCRTNIPSTWRGDGATRLPTADLYYFNDKIEVSKLSNSGSSLTGSLSNFINYAKKLKYIIGTLNIKLTGSLSFAFKNAPNLINLKIQGLGETTTVSTLLLDQSPNISQESILFAIQNANLKVSTTIKLHPDAHTRLSEDAEIKEAIRLQNENPAVEGCTISLTP